MKTCLLVSLLLLSLLISQSQGIRLDKGSFMSHKITKETSGGEGDDEVIVCKDGEECNPEAGNTRKLITNINTSTFTTTTVSKKNGGNYPTVKTTAANGFGQQGEPLHVNIPATSSSEIVDIAEMDYSPARRKPPIHN